MRKMFNDSEGKETLEAKNKRKTTKNEEEKKKTEPYSFPDDLASNNSGNFCFIIARCRLVNTGVTIL